ncbi:bacteriophage holin [Dyadobacter helix]|nr:bacteriophage holin [Dyadobacter sp. CECT 9275]
MKNTFQTVLASMTDKHFLTLSAAFAGFKTVLDTYFFSDWQFVLFLIIMIMVDTALGTCRAWKKKNLESRAWARLFEKLLLYGAVLIMSHVLIRFPISGSATGLFDWVDDVLYCAIMVREALSIFENVGEIKPDLLPAWILARLKKFDESGQFKDLM